MKPLSPAQRRVLDASTAEYHSALLNTAPDHPARAFMRERRLGRPTVESFRLGWCETPYNGDHEKLTGRLVIPNLLFDSDGVERVVGQKFRLLDHQGKGDGRPKFLYPKGQPLRLYNLRALALADDTIVVTEGESDTWTATSLGFNVVGVPGTDTWTAGEDRGAHRVRLFEGMSRVILLRDGDDAGETLVRAMEPIEGLEVRMPPKPFKDVSEMFLALGGDPVRQWIEGTEL